MASKKTTDGGGSVYQNHVKDCARPVDGLGNSTCKCRWRGAVVVGWQGKKPLRKVVTASTASGAATKVRQLREAQAAKKVVIGKSPTVETWLRYCLEVAYPRRIAAGNMREVSLVNYKGIAKNYLIPLLGHQRLDRLTADDIEDAWQTLREVGNPLLGEKAKPLSSYTVHHTHTVLSRALRLAIQKGKLVSNPAGPDSMDAPSRGDDEAAPLETEDWTKVLDVAPDLPNPARWTVALALGLRQGEALGLRWEDVNLKTGTMRIRQTVYRLPGKGIVFSEPKTDRSKRTIGLPDELVDDLKAHKAKQAEDRLKAGDQWQDHDLVFPMEDGRPFDPSVDRRRWLKLLKTAGVKPIKLHAARHTAATVMLLQGVDARTVMDIMGWSQISTAANYQHAVKEAHRAATAAVSNTMLAGRRKRPETA